MKAVRLDLNALRTRRLPGARAATTQQVPPGRFVLSRRDLLGLTGAAAAAVSPVARALGDTLRAPLEVERSDNRIAFKLEGKERWVVDARCFSGTPKLKVEESARHIRVALEGGRYPGTDLPADFTCELRRSGAGWKMSLQMAVGGFRCEAPFERWLLGQAEAASPVRLQAYEWALNGRYGLRLGGRAQASFRPDWTFSLSSVVGRQSSEGSIARADTPDGAVEAQCVEIALLAPGAASAMLSPDSRRTLVSLRRGEENWPLKPRIAKPRIGRLVQEDGLLDTLRLECSETAEGGRRYALLGESTSSRSAARYEPGDVALADDGAPFSVGLRNVRYAIGFDGGRERHALLADYEDEPRWLHGNGCSVLVGHRDGAAPFELVGDEDRAHRLHVAPALLGFAAPLEGAIVNYGPMPQDAHIELASYGLGQRAALQPQARLQIKLSPAILMALGRQGPSMKITRPDDMLALEIEMVNLNFKSDGSGPRLERTSSSEGAFLIVHFPSQNIAEQAFFETQPGVKPGDKNPPGAKDPDASKSGDEPITLPAASRLAGESRLAFFVPQSVNAIPYTIEALLDWTKLTPSVVPVAEPPPAPVFFLGQLGNILNDKQVSVAAFAAADANRLRINKLQTTLASRGKDLQSHQVTPPPKPPATALLQSTLKSPVALTRPPESIIKINPGIILLPQIREPLPTETTIEAPWRLHLSPHGGSGWSHASAPISFDGRTELWHTRLAVMNNGKPDESDAYYRTVRAVWSPDCPSNTAAKPGHYMYPGDAINPFRTSLDADDRYEIVRLSSDFTGLKTPTGKPVTPSAIPVDRLMLSSIGAWIELDGHWEEVQGLDVEEWQHRATMGRDQFVKVVYRGYLMPFGHRASLVKITERKVVLVNSQRIAVNRQRMFIVVREPEKSYPDGLQMFGGRNTPFTDVQILTKVTPMLDDPTRDPAKNSLAGHGQDAFWPRVGGEDFRFVLIGTDRNGYQTQFTMPLGWVESSLALPSGNPMPLLGIMFDYNRPENAARRIGPTNGAKIVFADSLKLGDTRLETESITWKAQPPQTVAAGRVQFYPALEMAEVNVPALRAFADLNNATSVDYPDLFLKNGFGPGNASELYVQVAGAPVNVTFSGQKPDGSMAANGDKTGGVGSPNMNMTALSRKYGPVGGAVPGKIALRDDARPGECAFGDGTDWNFDPKQFFANNGAILGCLVLADLVKGGVGGDGKNVPKIHSVEYPNDDSEENKKKSGVEIILDWAPEIIAIPPSANYADDPPAASTLFVPKDVKNCFSLKAKIEVIKPTAAPTNPSASLSATQAAANIAKNIKDMAGTKPPAPTWSVEGKLNEFKMALFGCIEIDFNYFKFTSSPESSFKPDPSIKDDGIKFMGALAFVNKLKDIIPGMGSSSSSGGGGHADTDTMLPAACAMPNVGGFDIGPDIHPTTSPLGIYAGVKVGIPTISVGLFSLQNIKVKAGVGIPFTGDPVNFAFDFCSQSDPFLLTVWLLGGGGWCHLLLDVHELQELTAGFQFGAMINFDITIASGGVYIKAGLTYSLKKPETVLAADGKTPLKDSHGKDVTRHPTDLTGYLQAGGYVSVLGIISLSLELYLGLEYVQNVDNSSSVTGTAQIEFHISILFFSATVGCTYTKTFAGSPAHTAALPVEDRRLASLTLPTGFALGQAPQGGTGKFHDQVDEPDWDAYCASFAFA